MLRISTAGGCDLSDAHCVTKHRLFGCVSLPIASGQHQTKLMASRCDQLAPAALLRDRWNEELRRQQQANSQTKEERGENERLRIVGLGIVWSEDLHEEDQTNPAQGR